MLLGKPVGVFGRASPPAPGPGGGVQVVGHGADGQEDGAFAVAAVHPDFEAGPEGLPAWRRDCARARRKKRRSLPNSAPHAACSYHNARLVFKALPPPKSRRQTRKFASEPRQHSKARGEPTRARAPATFPSALHRRRYESRAPTVCRRIAALQAAFHMPNPTTQPVGLG